MSEVLRCWGRRTIVGLLRENAREFPTRPFVRFGGCDFSHGEIESASADFAAALLGCGISVGSRVAIAMSNRPAFLVALFGVLRCGAVAVPLNTAYKADEYRYALEHARCTAIASEVTFVEVLDAACAGIAKPPPCFVASDTQPLGFDMPRDHVPTDADTVERLPLPGPDDLAGVFYTSGTTARPKGVMITHGNLVYSAEVTIRCLSLGAADVPALAFPLFHVNSLFYGVMTAVLLGGTLALLPGFSVSAYWEQVAEGRATWTPGITGPLMRLLLRRPPTRLDSTHGMRLAVGGTFLSLEEVEEFRTRFGVKLVAGWSMTETVSLATLHPTLREMSIPATTAIGFPTLGQEVRLARDDGGDAEPGEPGEILYRSPSMFAGYLDDPAATRAALTEDGWLRSGDLALMDETGYLRFVDRKKDMIKTRGENVAAAEVERVLNEHPGVLESAVIGVPSEDGLLGERVEAFVVRGGGTAVDEVELGQWVANKLADFKVPQALHFVPALPKTPIGKIQRQQLRAVAREKYQ